MHDIMYRVFAPFICVFGFIKETLKIKESFKTIPGIEGNFLLSTFKFLQHLFAFRTPFHNTCVAVAEVFPGLNKIFGSEGLFKFWLFISPIVLLTKADTVKSLLKCKENVEKSIQYSFMKLWLRNGLLTSDVKTWRRHRKLLAPTMYPKIIESYQDIFEEQSLTLAEKLSKTAGEPVNFLPLVSYCTLDIICETAMGIQLHVQEEENSTYFKSLHKLCSICVDRMSRCWLWSDRMFLMSSRGKLWRQAITHTRNFTEKIIKERLKRVIFRRESLKNNNIPVDIGQTKRSLPFLDLALELHLDKKSFTLQNVQDEIEVFLLGGHDTTAVTLSFALYLLGLHQDIQSKVFDELDLVFGSDLSLPVTVASTKQLKYMECVIKETLRLFPPIPVIGRKIVEDLIIGNKRILKGTTCCVLISEVHRDPEIYPEPEVFNPERFSQNGTNPPLDPFAFLAFSAGPRGCPGSKFAMLQMKTILSNVLRRFSVRSTQPRDKIILSMEMVQRPINGINLIFKSR